MRENRTYGSEGGEGLHPFPTPIGAYYCIAMSALSMQQRRSASGVARYQFRASPLLDAASRLIRQVSKYLIVVSSRAGSSVQSP